MKYFGDLASKAKGARSVTLIYNSKSAAFAFVS